MNLQGRSLLDISDLSREEIIFLIDQAKILKSKQKDDSPIFMGKSVALLFFEPSTRTRTSFEMAAMRTGVRALNLDFNQSSAQKGETIFDTSKNIEAL